MSIGCIMREACRSHRLVNTTINTVVHEVLQLMVVVIHLVINMNILQRSKGSCARVSKHVGLRKAASRNQQPATSKRQAASSRISPAG